MTLSTRAEIRQEVLRRIGGHIFTSTSDSTTTTGGSTMIGRFAGDDSAGKDWGIYDGTDADADKYRIATGYVDSTGIFTHGSITDRAGGETIEAYPPNDPTPYEFDEALNRALSETERIVETVMPTVEGSRHYTFLNAPWIERRRDALSVLYRASPNLLDNSNFELWGRGSDAQLHAWVLSGTSATATRIDGLNERFGVRLTSTGGNGAVLTQTIPIPIIQLQGKSISIFGRIKTSTDDMAALDITDGTSTQRATWRASDGSQHDGSGIWLEFTATFAVDSSAVGPVEVKLTLDTTNGNADYENVVAVEGSSVPEWLSKYGDQHARTDPILATLQMRGSLPVIVTDRTYSRGAQIVVQSRQPYFELTADSGTGGVTDMPFEAAVMGTIVKLAEVHSVSKPNAAKWERLGAYWLPKYNAWTRQLAEPSAEPTPKRIVISGA